MPIYPEPCRPGLYFADGGETVWIGGDTSEPTWDAAVSTVRAMVTANRLAIFARPRLVQVDADGVVVKETRDLSLSE